MSTSSEPALSSAAGSWRALVAALLAAVRALASLLFALGRAPFRRLGRTRSGRPTPASRIPIEVHLTDPAQQAEIEQAVRATLIRCARTWAPRPLPFDRVEVLYGAPARGQASTFTRWAELAPAEGSPRHRPLTVLSLGLTDDEGRALEAAEIAGAVAVQVRSVLAKRYMSEHPEPAPEANSDEAGVTSTGAPALPSEPITPTTPTTRGRAGRGAAPSAAAADPAASARRASVPSLDADASSASPPAVESSAAEAESSAGGAAKPLLRLLHDAGNADPLRPARPQDPGDSSGNT